MQETAALPFPQATAGTTAATSRFFTPRMWKLGSAALLLGAGSYGIFSEQQYVTSSNAIVSAYVLDVRSPIEGSVSGLPRAAGAFVRTGEPLAHVDNPLVDHEHLDNLRTLEDVAQSTVDADAAESAVLDAQRRSLVGRADAHAAAVSERLSDGIAEAAGTLAARQAAYDEASIELRRGRELHEAGITSNADYDRVVSAEAVARRTLEAQRAAVASLNAQRASAGRGLLSEPGTNNDVAYSRQRADEVALKLADTARSLAASQAQARQAHQAVAAEASRSAHLRSTELVSPVSGQVWAIDAMDGEHAVLDAPLVSLVDCTQQFLLVEVPQDRLPDIAVGAQARFRFAGESQERTGRVLAAMGDPQKEINHKFAAYPLQDTSLQLGTVRVQVDGAAETSCAIGRTARVLLPTLPTNFVSRAVRHYF